jgi:hypothetical protein
MTHDEAVKMVKGISYRTQRKIGNNTYAYIEHDSSVSIQLHGTKVVVIYPNGLYKLNSGGWQTSTTKDRINKYSPVKVYQKKHVWYLQDGTPFEDNILVNK